MSPGMSVFDPVDIRLSPKAEVRAIRHGAPWVYANELVLDRRAKAVMPGTIVRLIAPDGAPLALAAFNPASKIAARIMTRDMSATVDRAFLEARLATALALRERLYPEPFYRLVHAEADALPGVIIDRFGDALAIQPNAAWADLMFDDLLAAALSVTGCTVAIKNASGRTRALEGLDDVSRIAAGELTGPIDVRMNGAIYRADLLGGQKTGLFFDQRENHRFVAALAKGADVLDVFSHVGGFALAALAGGAKSALAIDASEAALALASEGAARSGFAERFATKKGDAFALLEAATTEGASYDLVIVDPPAFAPNKQALDAGLRAYERLAKLSAGLVRKGGFLCLCSCSHAADLALFRSACTRGIGRAGATAQLLYTGFAGPDHPQLPQLAESGYLKALVFRLT